MAQIRERMRKRGAGVAFAALVLLFWPAFAEARSAPQQFDLTVDVPAGEIRTGKLRGLVASSSLAIEVHASGAIDLIVIDEDGFQSFPEKILADFRARTEGRLSFALRIHETGTYYLILDNRRGDAPRRANITVTATGP